MYVRFIRPYIFTPDEDRRCAVKYKLGFKGRVRQQCADKAIAAGAAVAIILPDPDLTTRKGADVRASRRKPRARRARSVAT